uniref:Uncharacterized protein n=1 Tax=viral metagenome TaxID=1070528 RepID=A0A6C0I6K0_9ZZZZ
MSDSTKKTVEELTIPTEFNKIMNDFISDIVITFPEYSGLIKRWWTPDLHSETQPKEGADANVNPRAKGELTFVFRHCVKVLPERFFDILYKNVEIFNDNSEVNTEFLPGIVFKQLWKCDISDNTRETVWKYLQLVLFSVIGSVHNSTDFGDTAKLFEAINEDELKSKLSETLQNMQTMFDNFSSKEEEGEGEADNTDEPDNTGDKGTGMPNAEDLHKHISSMMDGKLGKLAMELAEETASELDIDINETKDAKDVFQQLFKNPGKLMNMVKNIGGKIEGKIKSGEIKESELMSEGMDLLNQMKNMPGMGDMSKIFSQMGMPGLGKNTKVNMGAMEAQMNKNMKMAKMKERMRAKVEAKEQPKTPSAPASDKPALSEEEIIKIFSTGEKVERTPRGAKPTANVSNTATTSNADKKKKKSKK